MQNMRLNLWFMSETVQKCKEGILAAIKKCRPCPCVLVLSEQGLVVVKRGDEKRRWLDGWRIKYVNPSLTDKVMAKEIAREIGIPFFDGWGGFVDGRDR